MRIEQSKVLGWLSTNLRDLKKAAIPLWHPLGFVSAIVVDESPDYVARLHFWPPGERRTKNPDWPIHTHTYDLSSFVLSGFVRDRQYVVGQGQHFNVYQVNYREGGSEIVSTPRCVGVSVTVDEIRTTGDIYSVPKDTFHETVVEFDSSALTFVQLTDNGGEHPLVLGADGYHAYPYDRAPYPRANFWAAVERALT